MAEQRAVGRIVRPHGVRGELVVEVRTDSPETRFADDATVLATFRDGTSRPLTVSGSRPHSGRLLVAFADVPDRDAADALRGAMLTVDPADSPPAQHPDEFYDHQLEGLDVRTENGAHVGTVSGVVHGPGGELLAVHRDGSGEVLVPFVREIVPEVNLAEGTVLIAPPEGLLD